MKIYLISGFVAAILTGVFGFALGRRSPSVVTTTVYKDKEIIKKIPEVKTVTVAGPVTTVVKRVRVLTPAGRCEETTTIEKVAGPVETRKESKGGELSVKVKEQSTTVVRTAELPRFSLEARGMVDLNFKPRFESLAVGIRVAGPLWLTAGASLPSRAALVGVRVTW